MKHSRPILISAVAVVCVAAAVVIALLYLNLSDNVPEVHLSAPEDTAGENGADGRAGEENSLVYAELRPDTVQYAIATIRKPTSYSCRYTVENFWEGGSNLAEVSVYVLNDTFRVTQKTASYTKEFLFTGEDYYIWYNGDSEYFHGKRGESLAGEEIADAVQMSGSYAGLLALDKSAILDCGYADYGEGYCIRVSADEGALGYQSVYYISPETGLLLANEVYDGERLIYRLSDQEAALSAPSELFFVLPDGTSVLPQSVQ